MKEESKQWDLTNAEIKKLRECQSKRETIKELMHSLLEEGTQNVQREMNLWSAIARNHRITTNGRLVSDTKVGKVWIKGKVPELDKLLNEFHNDNP